MGINDWSYREKVVKWSLNFIRHILHKSEEIFQFCCCLGIKFDYFRYISVSCGIVTLTDFLSKLLGDFFGFFLFNWVIDAFSQQFHVIKFICELFQENFNTQYFFIIYFLLSFFDRTRKLIPFSLIYEEDQLNNKKYDNCLR